MAIEKYIIDKSDLSTLLRGERLAIKPKGNVKGFCVEIAGNLTNGDVIMAMFPNETIKFIGTKVYVGKCVCFNQSWWEAPYKRGEDKE